MRTVASEAGRLARFWARVEKTDGCWFWHGAHMTGGYGRLMVNGRLTGAHRFAYELHVGPIPPGLHIDHLCRNPSCVNPAHLEAVTPGENIRRGRGPQISRARNLAKTHCKQGHLLSGDNIRVDRRGKRVCKTCRRNELRRYRADGRLRVMQRAHSAVAQALVSGRLSRQPCEVCGLERVDAHHDDYSAPLEVRWLCRQHHNEIHHSKAAA